MFVVYECVLIKWHAASKGFFLWLKTFFINVECSIELQALQRGCIRGVNRNRNRELKTQTKVHFAFLPVVVVVSSWFLCVFFSEYFLFFFALLYAVLSGSYISVVAITLTQFAVWCFLYTKGKSVSEWNSGCGLLLLELNSVT